MNNHNTDREMWKDVVEYEGIYQVSDLGRVRSLDRVNPNDGQRYKGRVLKLRNDRAGYKDVMLHKYGKPKRFKVHRLVAIAFIENPSNLPQINHKDEVKHNNHVDNLEWCDNLYNHNYGRLKTREYRDSITKRCGRPIYVHVPGGEKLYYPSVKKASEALDIHRSGIHSVLSNTTKSYMDYHFEYAELKGVIE